MVDSRVKIKRTIIFRFPESKPETGVIIVSKDKILLKPHVRFSKMHPSGMSMRCPSFAITRNIGCKNTKWETQEQPTDDGTTQSDIPTKVDIS